MNPFSAHERLKLGATSASTRTDSLLSYRLPPPRRKIADKGGKLLCALERNRVVVARPDSSQATVTLQPRQPQGSSLLQESFLSGIAALDPEADVHTRPHALVGDDLVQIRMGLQGSVDKLSLCFGYGFLSLDFVRVLSQQPLQNAARDIHTVENLVGRKITPGELNLLKDAECVVQAVVLRNSLVLEDTRRNREGQLPQYGRRRLRQEALLDDDNSNSSRP